jgi:hypothetical protein
VLSTILWHCNRLEDILTIEKAGRVNALQA